MRPPVWSLGCLLALMGCGQRPEEPRQPVTPSSPFKVQSVSLLSDMDGKPGKPVPKFDYRQRKQHFTAVLDHPAAGQMGTWVFSAKSTSAGSNKAIRSLQGKLDGDQMKAEIELDTDWPVGVYHVDILIAGQPVHAFDYEVTGQRDRLAFGAHSLAPDDGHGLPGRQVEFFKTTDRTIHVQVSTHGIDTTEPEVIWRLYKVDGAEATELGNTVQPRVKLQDSVLKAQFTAAGDWKPGTYRADVVVNGETAHSITFQIRK